MPCGQNLPALQGYKNNNIVSEDLAILYLISIFELTIILEEVLALAHVFPLGQGVQPLMDVKLVEFVYFPAGHELA